MASFLPHGSVGKKTDKLYNKINLPLLYLKIASGIDVEYISIKAFCLVQDTGVRAYIITITSVKGTVKDKSMPL